MQIKHLENIIGSGLFRYLRKSDYIDALEQLNITNKSYKKGEIIYYEGDIIDALCIVERGSVRGEKTYPNGEIHIVSIFDEGSIFCLEVSVSRMKTTPIDIIANEQCRVIYISMQSIEASAFSDKMHSALIEMLADDNIRMTHKVEILAERGLRSRVLVYLNVLARKSGTDTVSVKMSREQMAQYLCVNRSALSNELNKMKREGLIDFKRGQFRLLKPLVDPADQTEDPSESI
ncbi:MAG: Crp/Fnr family transcriptional regulator [Firmicutes bacterium]|nr:Crp/Fnr family transcriptional regulator [Bacillota bacterium]